MIIENVSPEINGGRFPAKGTTGERFIVEADIFTDGHDMLAAILRYRMHPGDDWTDVPMQPLVNDRWRGEFLLPHEGWCEYTLYAWIDWPATWRRDLRLKSEAGQDVRSELREGEILIRAAAKRAPAEEAQWLERRAELLADEDQLIGIATALDESLVERLHHFTHRRYGHEFEKILKVRVERERARHGSWYELFPRSCADEPGRHGTFIDVIARLPYIAQMGFDVLYLPPIHPIGHAFRKGPNNTLTPGPDDPGSPWAIGSSEGGHREIHPDLGTMDDFEKLVAAAADQNIEIALDIAFQCSPDHPYVKEHPAWFKHRPDGTIKYAENPPKKYQDIYPLDFESDDWQNLWRELRDVVLLWAERGVRIFRVDNPHTKPFRFWEWMIASVQERFPDTIFLSEAFTRPKVMKYLAKSGFTQSYSYFTWRNSRLEIEEYFTELYQTEVRHFMRPNLFANTPDILPEILQTGGPPAFTIRLLLAATLGATYGIYGPPFEQCVGEPLAPGKEEYLDSEKYVVRHWDWSSHQPFRELIGLVNRIRRDIPALQFDHYLRFHYCENQEILFFSKQDPHGQSAVLVIVSLDPYDTQSGWVHVPIDLFGIQPDESYQVHDHITGAFYQWHGIANFVSLNPHSVPAHILTIRRQQRREQDFDYYFA